MPQPNTMSFSNGNPSREYNKQSEKLRLIDRDCEIDWADKQILERKTKMSALKAKLETFDKYAQELEGEKAPILIVLEAFEDLGMSSALKYTSKLLDINAK